MNASEENRCCRCDAAIPATSTENLCPACLLSGALRPPSEDETITMAPGGPSSLYGPTDLPCVFGGYRLTGLLGRGGMGTVYEAEQIATGRRLALKMLARQLDSPEMRGRFLREGRLAARVNHPNSLYVFGSEEIEGLPAITMEIAGGGTLKDVLKQRGPLAVTEAVDAILDVVTGLESAFSHGVLHRDIKPSNCFVGPDGSVKVGDFGLSVSTLAKTDTFVTAHGKIMGTPAYASPEQLRGDALDLRADIYSVGATLFTLLTNRAPFEGDNAVQVVANAVNRKPPVLTALREDVPAELARVVSRCLAKEPDGRYADHAALRKALLPFSSLEPEPAPMEIRAAAGWVDYLIAFLPPYVAMMLLIGADDLLVQPLVERSLYSMRFYFALLGIGFLYFGLTEGLAGAGLGKWLKGLQVVRNDGRRPGFLRGLLRVVVPILSIEAVRMPVTMAFISEAEWTGMQTVLYVMSFVICGWIPALLALRVRHENRFATFWDLASGTRVVIRPAGAARRTFTPVDGPDGVAEGAARLGPYPLLEELVPGRWLVGLDPVLDRRVWLLRRDSSGPSRSRRDVARPGRPRWLQQVTSEDAVWDAYEATPGAPMAALVEGGNVPWSTLRHWIHDLASELWAASSDRSLPGESSLDHVWITSDGRAVLLDEPWPRTTSPANRVSVTDLDDQQRFLHGIAERVDTTGLPLHVRPVLRNIAQGKFEKLSFLTGTLRGMLERPSEVSRLIRAGSIFLLPAYAWIAFFVGRYHDKPWMDSPLEAVVLSALVVLGGLGLVELLATLFRYTLGQAVFRLAVIDSGGEPATRSRLLARWAVVWLPLITSLGLARWLLPVAGFVPGAAVVLLLWLGAAVCAAVRPHRGLQDRVAGTWVVRR